MSLSPLLVWFRQDLRLSDNPALREAIATGAPVVPVYILDDDAPGVWRMGGASRWWLHHSLASLARDLGDLGLKLILRRGKSAACLDALIGETKAAGVHWNRCYEPFAVARDKTIKADLEARGLVAKSFNANLLFEPWTIVSKTGTPFRVFTPFWKACLAAEPPSAAVPAPKKASAPGAWPASDALDAWALLPTKPDWAGGFSVWTPGEAGAQARLASFVATALSGYASSRDRPDIEATSRLSPHLHFGEISPRQCFHAGASSTKFVAELGWREFSHHLLFQLPDLPETALRTEFRDFPWRENPAHLRAWRKGATGYPIVDAGMRELWQTGWMHNRVRMIAASFLVKHLLQPWRAGEDWFWDTLVDADLANNAASWQWVAGCGADAAPYFRIFNPMLQGAKFDPDGAYVRRFVPELARLPAEHIHTPWEAPADVLARAGVKLGVTYPNPIVDHGEARARALAAFQSLKEAA
ncbi:MAG: deoxyribodipyrimidine photo-lyase [Magnetospirillum sp.]|nr:deoxyribodipyrimidine photo-lyase [Magnetospirillum sp.]